MGRRVGSVVGGRLGRTLLELGGNNGIIVDGRRRSSTWSNPAVLFGAVGTAGQRCTTTRRLHPPSTKVHRRCDVKQRLVKAYGSDPHWRPDRSQGTLMRTAHQTEDAVKDIQKAARAPKSKSRWAARSCAAVTRSRERPRATTSTPTVILRAKEGMEIIVQRRDLRPDPLRDHGQGRRRRDRQSTTALTPGPLVRDLHHDNR